MYRWQVGISDPLELGIHAAQSAAAFLEGGLSVLQQLEVKGNAQQPGTGDDLEDREPEELSNCGRPVGKGVGLDQTWKDW
jgi:hypothetical protein